MVASKLFAELKINHKVEVVSEYIKTWAYQGITPVSFDQFYIFAKQLRAEDLWLRHVDHIVTDSPLPMQCAYIERNGSPFLEPTLAVCRVFERTYPSLNIFLDRDGIPYHQDGRYENIEQAREMDRRIEEFMARESIPYTRLKSKDFSSIVEFVEVHLGDK